MSTKDLSKNPADRLLNVGGVDASTSSWSYSNIPGGVLVEEKDYYVNYCEQNYPETVKEFKKIQEENFRTFCKKQHDYGPNNISMGTELKNDEEKLFSLAALNVRVNDKIQRLLHLVNRKRDVSPGNESIEDSYLDMSVYGIIARLISRDKWAK